MAEKGTRISNDQTGEYVATRDAYENTAGGDARVVELVDFAGRQLTLSEVRGSVSPITSDDSQDLTSLPADLTGNKITVGDKSILVVSPQHSAIDGEVLITPIIFNSYDAEDGSSHVVAASADDRGAEYDGASTYAFFAEDSIVLNCAAAAGGDEYRAIMRFDDVLVGNGVTITAAYLDVFTWTWGGTSTRDDLEIRLLDEDDMTMPATAQAYWTTSYTGKVDWDASAYGQYEWATSPDISSIVQTVVDRVGWASGQAMGIMVCAGTDDGATNFASYDNTNANYGPAAARLRIQYNKATESAHPTTLQAKQSNVGSQGFYNGSDYISNTLVWDLYGAPEVGLHITEIGGTANGVVLKAGVI